MTYAIVNFGCRVNHADALAIEVELVARGGRVAPAEAADLVIVNSCSVTASADQGTRQTIRRLHRANPLARIVVTGCYATRAAGDVATLPGVTRVVPNEQKHAVAGIAVEMLETSVGRPSVDGEGACGAVVEPGVAGRTAWTLRVQTGCDEACSYCIIPRTRGASRSISADAVLRDVDVAVARGFKEVAIAGVHLGSWGRDLPVRLALVDLLRSLDAHDAPVRYRISSLEPMDCTDDVIDVIAASPRMAKHVHLPLQHASDRMLAAMRRPYTLAQFDRIVRRVADTIPGVAVGTDAIVGFPGESDADADLLASYLADAPVSHVHVFPYSDRPGTEASRMGDRASGAVIRDRGLRLRDVSRARRDAFGRAQVGTHHTALTLEDGTLALTGNYLKLRVPRQHPRNTWVPVIVTSPDTARFPTDPPG